MRCRAETAHRAVNHNPTHRSNRRDTQHNSFFSQQKLRRGNEAAKKKFLISYAMRLQSASLSSIACVVSTMACCRALSCARYWPSNRQRATRTFASTEGKKCDQQDGDPCLDDRPEEALRVRVEAVRRLVEHHHRRRAD